MLGSLGPIGSYGPQVLRFLKLYQDHTLEQVYEHNKYEHNKYEIINQKSW